MELSFDRKTMLGYISMLAKVAPQEASSPAITGILLEADDQNYELTMTAANGVSALRLRCDAAVRKAGRAIVNAQMFLAFLSKLDNSLIKLSISDKGRVVIKTDSTEVEFSSLPAGRFPDVGFLLEEDAPQLLEGNGWPALLSRPLFCASRKAEPSTVPTDCLSLSAKDGMLKTVCCDGSRIFSTQKPCECDTVFSVLLPDRAASLLAGLVKEGDTLSLHTAQGCVQFRTQNFLYAAAPIRCAYFPVDAVISNMSPVSSAVVNAKQLCDSLELAAAASSPVVNLTIASDAVQLRPLSRLAKADLPPVTAKKCKATDGKGFYYRTYKLLQGCQAFLGTNNGSVKMWMTAGGAMVLEAPGSYYMLPVSKPPKAKKAESQKAA